MKKRDRRCTKAEHSYEAKVRLSILDGDVEHTLGVPVQQPESEAPLARDLREAKVRRGGQQQGVDRCPASSPLLPPCEAGTRALPGHFSARASATASNALTVMPWPWTGLKPHTASPTTTNLSGQRGMRSRRRQRPGTHAAGSWFGIIQACGQIALRE